MSDDKRESAKIVVALSSQLIAAKVAMLTLTGAIAIFALTYKSLSGGWYFGFLALVAIVAGLFIRAIERGARGISKVAEDGQKEDWSIEAATSRFHSQTRTTFLGLAGLLVLAIATSMAESKESPLEIRVNAIEKSLQVLLALERDVADLKARERELRDKAGEHATALKVLDYRVTQLEKKPRPRRPPSPGAV
jgi:hypothetical protein